MANFKRFRIGDSLPEGYRLATVDDVLQHGHAQIRAGKWLDVQDFGDDYFYYYCRPLDFDKTRLKDGFIDNNRNLTWRKFGGLCVVDKLAILSTPSADVKLCSSSLPNKSDDDHRVVALLYACLEEDIDEIKGLLREHGEEIILVNLDGVPSGGNALHLCAWEGKIKSLKYLLKAIDKEAAAKAVGCVDGETPLLLAALRGYVQDGKAVKMLLHYDKSQINTRSKEFQSTPLAMAISWSQSLEVCEELLKVKEIEIDQGDEAGNTALHFAAQISPLRVQNKVSILKLLLEHCGFEQPSFLNRLPEGGVLLSDDFIKSIGDSNQQGRNFRSTTIKRNRRRFINIQNKIKETPLYHALANISSLPLSSHRIVLDLVILLISAGANIMKTNVNGETVLHHVCKIQTSSKVETTIVRILHACFKNSLEWLKYARMKDLGGQTSLHKAASSGNKDVVSILLSSTRNEKKKEEYLKRVKDLVHERDFDGLTALHSTIRPKDNDTEENDQLEIVKMLVDHAGTGEEDSERLLLLWAIAENRGTVEEMSRDEKYELLKNYLAAQKKPSNSATMMETACKLKRNDMIEDLFNNHPECRKEQSECKEKDSWEPDKRYKTITSDQPSFKDRLERKDITRAIATLLLNQRIGSPITIGIFGGTGMGKSSLMMQVQCKMLEMAARTTINENNRSCEKLWRYLNTLRSSKVLYNADIIRFAKKNCPELKIEEKNDEYKIVKEILHRYHPELSLIFKRLALRTNKNDKSDRPALLTVEYNALQYEKQDEAWAGLAVNIAKEMVRSGMTAGQEMRISWLYAFRNNRQNFFINLILPAMVAVFLGGFFGWFAWKLLSVPDIPLLKNFQYGSIPLSVFLVVWFVLKNILNEVKPVSEKLGSDYRSLSSMNEEKLGFQNRVIEDIQFLQKEIYRPTLFLWNWIALFWKCVIYLVGENGSLELSNDLKGIPKEGSLRIVVFIDNLDRSKEEFLMPLNTILSSCDINAVIAIDKRQGERIMRQLIQLPIVLLDPSVKKLRQFLKDQVDGFGIKYNKNSEPDIFDFDFDDDGDDKETSDSKELDSNRWDAHYTTFEIETFEYVAQHAYGDFLSPREWKSLLNYHRLVRSIFSQPNRWKKVKFMKGWKRQLIVWLFFCWHWKKPMNAIIKNWSSLVAVPPQLESAYKENASRALAQISHRSSSPTQRWLDFVQKRVHCQRQDELQLQQRSQSQEELQQQSRTQEEHDSLQHHQQDMFNAINEIYPTLKTILELRMERLSEDYKHPRQIRKNQEDLERMIATLEKGQYDVTMSGILSFQEFRFDCKAGYLKLSVPELLNED